jgi:hypothetical protein
MKSIGRNAELARIRERLASFRDGRQRSMHMAVAAPEWGGLAEFLDDALEVGKAAGYVAVRTEVEDHLHPDRLLEPVNLALQKELGSPAADPDGALQTTLDFFERLRRSRSECKVLLVADVSQALQRLRESGAFSSGVSDPLLARLRALANKIEDDELPFALIVGWHEDFRSWAPQFQAGDVIDRYAPAETLFADYGLGRDAWPLFKEVFTSAGVQIAEELPGLCGSGLPAGLFAQAARTEGRRIDGPFALDVLRKRTQAASLAQIAPRVDDNLLIRLCLRDEILTVNPELGNLVEARSEGGYVATRELYGALGLVPPRQVVSLADHVRQRLEDGDVELETEVGGVLAQILCDGSSTLRGQSGWHFRAAPKFAETHPLGELEILLLISLYGELTPSQREEAFKFASEAESSAEGATKLVLVAYHGALSGTQVRRELLSKLQETGVSDPRPRREEERTTQGRFLAVLCLTELSSDHIVGAARLKRDPGDDNGLGDELYDSLTNHFRTVSRRMPLLRPNSVQAGQLGPLLSAQGQPIEMAATPTSLLSLRIVSQTEGRKYLWRWADDQLIQCLWNLKSADALKLSGYYTFAASDWAAIGASLSGAYTSDLIVWEKSLLKAADPIPLLKIQLQRSIEAFNSMLTKTTAENRVRFLEQLQMATSNLDEANDFAAAIGKLADLRVRLEIAIKAALEEEAQLQERLNAELAKIADASDLPAKFAEELAALRETDASVKVVEKARELAVKVEQERDRQKQRASRLEPVRREIEKLPPEKREVARKLLDDQSEDVAEIRSKVEELRIGHSLSLPASDPPSEQPSERPPPSEVRTQTFSSSPEDLTQLADLFGNPKIQILKVDVRS